jgi:hypothetical protein
VVSQPQASKWGSAREIATTTQLCAAAVPGSLAALSSFVAFSLVRWKGQVVCSYLNGVEKKV